MIETLIQELIDALNRNTATNAALASALGNQAPAKRTRAKAAPSPEPAGTPEPEAAPAVEPEVAPAVEPEVAPAVKPEVAPAVEPAAEDITIEQILGVVQQFRKDYPELIPSNKAALAEVLEQFNLTALSKAQKAQFPELLAAVKGICQ